VAAEVVLFGFGQKARRGCEGGSALLSLAALSAGLVAVIAAIPDELKPFFRDMSGKGGQGIQRGEPFRGEGRQVRAGGGALLIGNDAGVAVIVEPGERKGCVDKV